MWHHRPSLHPIFGKGSTHQHFDLEINPHRCSHTISWRIPVGCHPVIGGKLIKSWPHNMSQLPSKPPVTFVHCHFGPVPKMVGPKNKAIPQIMAVWKGKMRFQNWCFKVYWISMVLKQLSTSVSQIHHFFHIPYLNRPPPWGPLGIVFYYSEDLPIQKK